MSSNYWSSTTNANNTENAWNVNFNNGNVNNNNKSNSYYVRAVRAGKCPLLSFQSLYGAYLDCRKRKRGTINAIQFELDLLARLAAFKAQIVTQSENAGGKTVQCYSMAPGLVHRLMQALTSYLGHFEHADSYHLTQSLFARHQWLCEDFHVKPGRLIRSCRHKAFFRFMRAQVRFFRAALAGPLYLFEVGRFIELYNDDAIQAGLDLGLRVEPGKRGMVYGAGFPAKSLKRMTGKLLDLGKELAVIKELGVGPFVKQRHITELYRIG